MNLISFIPQIKTENFLLALAVLIELCMAGLGVAIGFSIIDQGYAGLEVSGAIKFIPGFVFFVIAVVELARVPLVLSIYRGNSLWWRWIGGLFLLLIMGITFESMLIGLQTNNMYALSEVTNHDIKISQIEKKISFTENKIIKVETDTEEVIQKNYEIVIERINENEEKRVQPIKDEINDLNRQFNSGQIEILNREIENFQNEIKKLPETEEKNINKEEGNKSNAIELISNEYQDKKTILTAQIKNLLTEINTNTRNMNQKKKYISGNESFLLKKKERKKIQIYIDKLKEEMNKKNSQLSKLPNQEAKERVKTIEEFDTKIKNIQIKTQDTKKSLNINIKNNHEEIFKIQSTERLGIQEEITKLKSNVKKAYDEYDKQRVNAKTIRDENLTNLKEKKDVIKNFNEDIETYQDELAEVKAEKSNLTKSTIVFNFATHLDTLVKACEGAENTADVTPQCRKVTENIWFGIISFIVSATGTAVALGSEVLRSAPLRKNRQRPMRYMFARILRNVTRPKIKIKEVPVEKIVEVTKVVPEDKVVYKEVPKIHEVIKKETVYIPLPTAREDLIKDKEKNKDADKNKDKDKQ